MKVRRGVLLFFLCLLVLSGCSSKKAPNQDNKSEQAISAYQDGESVFSALERDIFANLQAEKEDFKTEDQFIVSVVGKAEVTSLAESEFLQIKPQRYFLIKISNFTNEQIKILQTDLPYAKDEKVNSSDQLFYLVGLAKITNQAKDADVSFSGLISSLRSPVESLDTSQTNLHDNSARPFAPLDDQTVCSAIMYLGKNYADLPVSYQIDFSVYGKTGGQTITDSIQFEPVQPAGEK